MLQSAKDLFRHTGVRCKGWINLTMDSKLVLTLISENKHPKAADLDAGDLHLTASRRSKSSFHNSTKHR
jgi:hypothetical protein